MVGAKREDTFNYERINNASHYQGKPEHHICLFPWKRFNCSPPTCGVTFSISKKQLSITSAEAFIQRSHFKSITNEIKTTKMTLKLSQEKKGK